MKRQPPHGARRAFLLTILLWLAAFSLACRVTSRLGTGSTTEADSVLQRTLGAARAALGQSFYIAADNYFHLGVEPGRSPAVTNLLFQRWGAVLRPSGHVHAEAYGISEIIPWLRVAMLADPENTEAFLTTAYWLRRLNRQNAAEQVLLEAQRRHPRDFRILAERGLMAFQQRRDDRAALLTEAALRVWPSPLSADDEEAKLQRARLLSLRALLYELAGAVEPAKALFLEAHRLMPANTALQHHITLLESGHFRSSASRETLEHLFPSSHRCARGEHDHEHEHED